MTRRIMKNLAIALVSSVLTAAVIIAVLVIAARVWGVMALVELLAR